MPTTTLAGRGMSCFTLRVFTDYANERTRFIDLLPQQLSKLI